MKKGFCLTNVQCNSCKMAAGVNPNFFPDLNTLMAAGAQLHKDSGIICGKPLLVLVYVNMLVSNEILQQTVPTPLISTPNGH